MSLPIRLDRRAVISVSGPDAETFLNGLLTQSTLGLEAGDRRYAALLTPQGKVIADMIVAKGPAGFLLDIDGDVSDALVKRLTLFRLRAAVSVEARRDLAVFAFDGAPDPRSAAAPPRSITSRERAHDSDMALYHAVRIAAGVPEQGVDFGSEDVFPADINMDLLNGVDFRKGCFVGQEVVSRMKRRGTARRRTLAASLASPVSEIPCPVFGGETEIGMLTSVSGSHALARLRIDRLAESWSKGEAIAAGGQPVDIFRPDWLAAELDAMAQAREPGARP